MRASGFFLWLNNFSVLIFVICSNQPKPTAMKSLLACLLLTSFFGYSQTVMSVPEAKEKGLFPKVDSVYTSAFDGRADHKAVFKKQEDIDKHVDAYHDYLKGLGKFLSDNNFKWEKDTKGWNRIYMQPDGTIDYFIYSLKDIPAEKEKEFRRLLALYIKGHKFGNTAPEKFAQCSSVTYPKSE